MKIEQPKIVRTESFVREIGTAGSHPCLFHCNDGNQYYVKYSSKKHLINEFIGAHLAQLLNINIPDWALVEINPDLIDLNKQLQSRIRPQGIGFGSKNLSRTQSFTDMFKLLYESSDNIKWKYRLNKDSQKMFSDIKRTFLQIVLFDIWVVNDDRVINNTNLIIEELDETFILYGIDHAAIFAQLDYKTLKRERDAEVGVGNTLINSEPFYIIQQLYGLLLNEEVKIVIQEMEKIDENILKIILNLVPASWSLDDEDKNNIIDFLLFRKNITKEQFYNLLEV